VSPGGKMSLIKNNPYKPLLILLVITILIFPILLSLDSASAADEKKVLFDETGATEKIYTIYNIGVYGSSGFANLLQQNGYSISKLTGPTITADELKGYDVLIIMTPYRNFTDEEVDTIKEFVNNGGGLLLVGSTWGNRDGDENFSFNKIARGFGVSFANNEVLTDTQHYLFFSYFVKVADLRPSPITSNITEYYSILGTYIKDPGPSTAVAYTYPESWGDQMIVSPEGDLVSNYQRDPNETGGPLPVISQMQYGKGKIVFMGAAATFVNSFIYRGNGWKLGLNSVNWLANNQAPPTYKKAGLMSYTIGDIGYRIIGMLLLTLILISGLIFLIKMDKKSNISIKTIKNWKFNALIIINSFFTVLAAIMFIPINFYLFDITLFTVYDPNLGYTLIITGALFLFFMGVILFNLLARQRLVIKYSYFTIVILILFIGLTTIMGDIFSFPMMPIFTVGSLILLIPLAINLWIYRGYGPYLVIEGREFDRLQKLSTKSLPYELLPFYSDSTYIGEGGFGRVFKATNQDGVEVALKIPKSFDKKSEKTFITEVSNWRQLDHPNIVKLYDYKILPIPYIETEYFAEGHVTKGMKTLEESVSIVYDVAKGLSYAHSKNIIHGDVKLANILIKNGVYKISDWGLSKMKSEESVTLLGATPSYAAPEQISQEFGKADERTDIYQLGNVFYELLTGRLPFEGDISEIYSSILNTQPLEPVEINPNAKPVNEIILKCLSKNKDERYSSMDDLLQDLKKYRPPDETIYFDDQENKS
jgi:eukaryotic-like serine/threonine-protein kinase